MSLNYTMKNNEKQKLIHENSLIGTIVTANLCMT